MSDKLHILQHSLGLDQYGEGNAFRNHFVAGGRDLDVCRELASVGLMNERAGSELSGGSPVFMVTPQGIDFVALQSPARPSQPRLSRSQKNYQAYLAAGCSLSFCEWMGFPKRAL